jgi:methylated-DNA-protein-cysteine methyltransferase-like protein
VFERVYALVRTVPAGRVTTYGQVATLVGSPRAARAVGYAMAASGRETESVPWHRVINARGGISNRGDFDGAEHQRELLEREGVEFREDGTVDLDVYRWHFPDYTWPDDPLDPDARPRRPGALRSR